jgi:hypothetical protein
MGAGWYSGGAMSTTRAEPHPARLDAAEPSEVRPTRAATLRLNRSERTYLALEGISGSITQVYGIRFATQVTAGAVRAALREVVRARPRLRGVVERTLFGHRLRILPEGPTVDALFELVFRELAAAETDDASLGEAMSALLNESFAVERDLPIKARFIPHPERPALLLSVHHITGDGKTVMAFLHAMLRALDGERLEPEPLDPSGYDAAMVPLRPLAFLRALARALAAALAPRPRRGAPLRFPRRPLLGFGPAAVAPLQLRTPASALVKAARARGTTLGTLVFSAAALALRRMVPDEERGPVRARLSIDLRDLFPGERKPTDGNYVSSFFVEVEPRDGFDAMLPAIDAGMREGVERFRQKTMFLVGFANELSLLLGRKLFGLLAVWAKRRDRMPAQSFHLSNLGRIDGFDRGGAQIDAVFPSIPHHDLFLAALGFRGGLQLTLCYPRGEISDASAKALLEAIDVILAEVAATERPEAQPAA